MAEREYVLGTHDEEIERLGLQHRVWRDYVRDAWQRAGLAERALALDVGCGPGYAALDLAAAVGPRGRVIAIDQSQRFLDHLESRARASGWSHVATARHDLSVDGPPAVDADMAWCRWIFAFVRDPRGLLTRVHRALRPGGRLVVHEYFDYATWRMLPGCPELDRFVAAVMDSWRADGGEPDIARDLPSWMTAAGLEVQSARPLIYAAAPGEGMWEWPAAFVRVGLRRLVDLQRLQALEADDLLRGFERAASSPGARMVTPGVLEIIATVSASR